jgi:cyclophilin family peptidyl-prolyl cis-trans isomerase
MENWLEMTRTRESRSPGTRRENGASTRMLVLAVAALVLLSLRAGASTANLADCEGDLTPSNPDNTIVELRFAPPTGSICVEVLEDQAPIAAATFLENVRGGYFDRTFISWIAEKSFLIAGIFQEDDGVFRRLFRDGPTENESCNLEGGDRCPERSNVAGTLAVFQQGGFDASWFINTEDNGGPDGLGLDAARYAVFARILGDGLQAVKPIADYPSFPPDELYYSAIVEPVESWTEMAPQGPLVCDEDIPGLVDGFNCFEDPMVRGDVYRANYSRMPVRQIPQEASNDEFGCFDIHNMSNLYATVNPETFPVGVQVPDPQLPQVNTFLHGIIPRGLQVSGGCGSLLDRWEDFIPHPNTDCMLDDGGDETDRLGVGHRSDVIHDQFWEDLTEGATVDDLDVYSYTCEEIVESNFWLEERRQVMGGRIIDELALIERAVVVPEPGAALYASLLTLGALARRRSCQRSPHPPRRGCS